MKKRTVMTAHEAQEYYRVTNQTLIAWSKASKIETMRTIGGWRRYIVYIDVPYEETPSEQEQQAENEAQRSEIEAKIARYKKHLGKDTLLGRVAESSIPSLERDLANLS